jgi:hypothetical protein
VLGTGGSLGPQRWLSWCSARRLSTSGAGCESKPRDAKDAARYLARDLADIAGQLASLKGEANAYLRDPNYNTLKLRLEVAHSAVEAAAVEARRRVRLNEGR